MIEAFFFGPSNQQVFASYHPPVGGNGQVLTVICPPLFNVTLSPFVDSFELESRRLEGSSLTCFGVLTRGQMAECTVGPMFIVVDPPCFDLLPGLLDRNELVHVQAFIAQPSVEGFAQAVLRSPLAEYACPALGPPPSASAAHSRLSAA